jgi:predicted RNA-binding protein with RPS1 domain
MNLRDMTLKSGEIVMESDINTGVENSVEVKPKMYFKGKILKVGLAGALVDIGAVKPAMIHISQIISDNVEPIKRVEDVLQVGQEIDVWVKRMKEDRVELTMIKPLDLEWRDIKKGMTVKGKVVRLEKFGAFVEIGAERPGLIHISEMAHGYVRQPSDVVKEEDEIEAQVIDVNRKKRQIKLSIKALLPEPVKEEEPVHNFVEMPKREKPVRKKKSKATRGKGEDMSGDVDELIAGVNQPEMEAEPTAMEMAMREAMERAKARKQEEKSRKSKAVSSEQEEILSRTLGQKVQS